MHMLRLRLLVDYRTEPIVEKRFRILAHISNQLRKHVKKQLSRLEKDKVYQELKKEYGRLKKLDPDNHEEVAADLSRISGLMGDTINELGLTKSGLEKYASVMQRRYKKNISSHQVQAEVAHILKGLEKVLYGDGKDIHYKKERDFTTIPGKSCSNGVILHFDQDDEKHDRPGIDPNDAAQTDEKKRQIEDQRSLRGTAVLVKGGPAEGDGFIFQQKNGSYKQQG